MDYRFGPRVEEQGTHFNLWAPSAASAVLELRDRASIPLQRGDDGFWKAFAPEVGPGQPYRFVVNGKPVPDLASREQETDGDGWSLVRGSFGRTPMAGPLSPWDRAVICEVHVGTATPEGTFAALRDRLEYFRDAGYTTLELMPIADFPGTRNWGYDGTLVFAPDRAYGSPDDLRSLVDRAHELGVCIVLDVVYNHFGSVYNYVPDYCPEWFDPEVETPWGPGIDFARPEVRQFYCDNAVWWLTEYDFDGIRFDAIHEMKSDDRDLFLGELAVACRAAKPGCKLVIENTANSARWLHRDENDEPTVYSAQWNDDYHHVVSFLLTGEAKSGYDDKDRDPVADLEKALADGFVHDNDAGHDNDGRDRGGPASQLPMEAFVQFLENHDWVGNRPDAKRLSQRLQPAQLDFARFLTMLNPQIPLIFMGNEAGLGSPFPFFFDLPEADAEEKRNDRYRQMRDIFKEEVGPGGLPDPQDPATFDSAKLPWSELDQPEHQQALATFRNLASLRRELIWPLTATRCLNAWSARQGDGIICTWQYEAGCYNMALNPTPAAISMSFHAGDPAASVGGIDREGERARLAPWSAMVWRS